MVWTHPKTAGDSTQHLQPGQFFHPVQQQLRFEHCVLCVGPEIQGCVDASNGSNGKIWQGEQTLQAELVNPEEERVFLIYQI